MSNYTSNTIITTIIAAMGLAGLGYGIAMHNKLSKVSERLDRSIDDLADDMEIDISDELINKAVDKAVNTQVKEAVSKATNEALIEVRCNIRRKVSAAVDKEYENIKDSVLKETTAAASKIDANKVRRDVEKAAEKAALEKFDVNLEDILKKFNNDLDNAAKVYSAIRSMITPAPTASSNREFVVKLG